MPGLRLHSSPATPQQLRCALPKVFSTATKEWRIVVRNAKAYRQLMPAPQLDHGQTHRRSERDEASAGGHVEPLPSPASPPNLRSRIFATCPEDRCTASVSGVS